MEMIRIEACLAHMVIPFVSALTRHMAGRWLRYANAGIGYL